MKKNKAPPGSLARRFDLMKFTDDLAADRLVPMAGSVPAQLIPVDPDALTRAAARLDPAAASTWTDRLEGAWAQALRAGLIPLSVLDRLGVSA